MEIVHILIDFLAEIAEGDFLRSRLIKMLSPLKCKPWWKAVNMEAHKGGNLP